MRVKITQPGWETYSGPLFGVQFENAISQDHIRRDQALQLGAMLSGVVEVDDNDNELGPINPAHEMIMTKDIAAEVVTPMARDSEVAPVEPETPAEDAEKKTYTEAELIEIADDKGIAGLREIGTPLGVKNTAIRGMIRDILAAQNSV